MNAGEQIGQRILEREGHRQTAHAEGRQHRRDGNAEPVQDHQQAAFIGAAPRVSTIGVVAWLMFAKQPWLAGVALTITPLLVLANVYFGRTIHRTSRGWRGAVAGASSSGAR